MKIQNYISCILISTFLFLLGCYDKSKFKFVDKAMLGTYKKLQPPDNCSDKIIILNDSSCVRKLICPSFFYIDTNKYKFIYSPQLNDNHLNVMGLVIYNFRHFYGDMTYKIPETETDSFADVSFFYEVIKEKEARIISNPEARSFDYILEIE